MVGVILGPNASCREDEFVCSNGHCINPDYVCDFEDDCLDRSDELNCRESTIFLLKAEVKSCFVIIAYIQGQCDFQNMLCGWLRVTPTVWYIDTHASANVKGTGPSFDHTYQNNSGYYLFSFSGHPRPPGQEFIVYYVSDFPAVTDGSCLFRFWYHMYGVNMGRLEVQQEDTVLLIVYN